MARVNLDKFSVVELRELQQDVAQALVAREAEERAEARAEMMALAAKRGFSLDDLLGKGKGKRGGAVAIKYRNPDNASETWTGRGRQPRWLVPLLKKGAKLEKFLVK